MGEHREGRKKTPMLHTHAAKLTGTTTPSWPSRPQMRKDVGVRLVASLSTYGGGGCRVRTGAPVHGLRAVVQTTNVTAQDTLKDMDMDRNLHQANKQPNKNDDTREKTHKQETIE